MEQNKEKFELNPEVKSHTLAPGAPGVFENRRHGSIDVRTVSAEKVAELVEGGCKHFIPKGKAEEPVKKSLTA